MIAPGDIVLPEHFTSPCLWETPTIGKAVIDNIGVNQMMLVISVCKNHAFVLIDGTAGFVNIELVRKLFKT